MSTATRQYMPPNGRLQTTNLVSNPHTRLHRSGSPVCGLAVPDGRTARRYIPARDDKTVTGNVTSLEHVACVRTARQ